MAGRGGKRRQVLQLGSASKLHRYGYSKEFHSRDKKDKAVVPTLVGDYSDTESEGSSEAQEKLDEDFKDEEVDAALAFTATSTDPVVGLSDGIDGSAMHDKPSDMDDELKNFLSEIEAIPVPVELEGTEQEKLPESDTNSTNVSATVSEVPKPTTKSGYGSHQYSMFVKGESEFVRNAEETKEDKVDKISEELKEEDIPEEPHTDWQMVQDEQSQYYYYWNTVTNEVTWEIPTEYTQYLLLHREYEDKIAKFTPEQLQALKEKIKLAVKNSGITLSGDETSPPNSVQELNSTEDHCSIVTSQAEDDKSHKVSIDSEPAFATQRRPSPAKVLSYPDTDTNSKHHKHKKEKRGHHKKKHKQKHRDSEEDKSTSKIPDISTSTVISESSTAVLVPGKILTSIVPYLSDQDDDEDDGNDNTNQIHSPSFSAAEPGVKEQGPAQVKEYGPKWVKEQGLTQVKEYGPTWVKDQGPTQVKEQGVTEVKEYGPKWDKEQGPSQVKEYGPTLVKEQGLSEVKDHGPAQAVLGPLLVTEQEPTQIKEQVPIEVKDQGPIEVKEQGSIKVKGQGPHWIKEQRPTEVQDQEPSEVQEQGPTEDKEQPQGSILENELIPAGTESSLSADAASSQVLTTHDIPHIVLTSEAAADLISVLLLPPPPPPPPPEEVSTTDELVLTTHSFEGDNLTTNSIDGPRLHTDEPDHQNTLDRSAADSINTGVISEEFSAMAVLSQQPTITENKIETHNNTEQDSSLGLVNSEEAQATNKVKQAIDMFAEYFPTELCTEKELTSTTENNMDMHTDKGASNGAEPADRMMEEGEIDEALEKVSFQPQVKCETSNNIEEDSTVIKRKEKQDRGPLSKGISIIGYAIDEEEVEKDVRDTIVKREKTTSKQKKKDKKDKKKDSKRHRKELKDDLSIDKVEKKIVHDISAENDKAVQSADKKTERKTTHDISTESDKIVHQSAYQKVEKKKSAHDFSEDKTVHFTDKKAKKKSFHDFSGVHEKTDHSADNKAEKKTIYDISAVSDKAIHSEDKKVGKKTVNDFTAANDKAICSVDSKVENKTSICISAMGEKVIPFTSNEGPFETTVNCVEERNDDDDDNGDIDLEDVDDIDRALEVALEKKKAEQLAQMDDKENRYVGENITTAVHGKYDQPQVKTAVILTQPNDSDLKGLTANGVSSQPSEKQISANEAEEKSSEKEGDSHMLAIKDMAELALSKLEFLDISTDNLSRLQVLFIELQTRYTDWTTGGLGTPYFYKQLKIAEDLLEQYELSAVPEGWVCQWDRYGVHRLYFHINKSHVWTRFHTQPTSTMAYELV